MTDGRKSALKVTQGAVIAALYVALTLIFAPISFGEMQVRISEALTILPLFTPAAIPGLFLSCVLGNLLCTVLLRHKHIFGNEKKSS